MSNVMHSVSDSISILQWNILGLQCNYPTLSLAITEDNFDVIVLQETLLPASNNFSINRYSAFHSPFIPNQSRGISIFIKSSIPCEEITPPPDCGENIESIGVKLTLQNTDLHIFNVYRPPRADCSLELEE